MRQLDESNKKKSNVKHLIMTSEEEGQRIDNFLLHELKGMPKSRIYRLLRKGEVRVNMKRVSPFYRLQLGDKVRLPPVLLPEQAVLAPPSKETVAVLSDRVLYEDDYLLIINKPSGMSVHAGSTVRMGVIETLRHLYPKLPNLELAHRLDAETSGCLVLAKKKRVLRELHGLLREGQMTKIYWALTKGKWKDSELKVDQPLHKDYKDGGKHVVEVSRDGKTAMTIFRPLQIFTGAALMEAKLLTGRTHQIRVHAAYQGHPIACDDRYGELEFNKRMRDEGLKRMFLHARVIEFILPSSGVHIRVEAPLDKGLQAIIDKLADKRGK